MDLINNYKNYCNEIILVVVAEVEQRVLVWEHLRLVIVIIIIIETINNNNNYNEIIGVVVAEVEQRV